MKSLEEIKADIIQMETKMTERRIGLLRGILAQRTRHFAMVLEDFYDPHNMSAVVRTSEVFGFQDVHVIEELNPYKINKSVMKGSVKWMNIKRYQERQKCMDHLKEQGYRIAVASTNTDQTLDMIDLSTPTAFYLGTEGAGNHPDTLKQADIEFKLPQYGITESMNVSVAAGCLMTNLELYLRREGREKYTLEAEEQERLLHEWYSRHLEGFDEHPVVEDIC